METHIDIWGPQYPTDITTIRDIRNGRANTAVGCEDFQVAAVVVNPGVPNLVIIEIWGYMLSQYGFQAVVDINSDMVATVVVASTIVPNIEFYADTIA